MTAAQDASLLFEAAGTNRSLIFHARKGDADAAFRDAPYVRRETLRTGRHYGLTMESRGVMAEWDATRGKLKVSGAAKVPFFNRRILAKQIGLPEDAIEMIENDVGGGYGARGEFYPEDFLIPFAARHVNRPVKWTEDRRENLMAMNHAREAEADLEIACARDGTILALRGDMRNDLGAYMRTNGAVGTRNIVSVHGWSLSRAARQARLASVDDQQDAGRHLSGTGPLRVQFLLERLLDMVASDLAIDRVEFRRRNLVTQPEQPYPIAHVQPTDAKDQYDSGDYPATLERCLKEIRWDEKSKLAGKLIDGLYHGLGIVCFIEGGAAGPKETARLAINDDGTISVYLGTTSVGQGVETIFAQIAADALEVPIERIHHVYHGSTGYVSDGYGAYHSRSTVMGGSALLDAAKNFLAALREDAAQRMGCDPAAITLDEDKVAGPGGKTLALTEFAGLSVEGAFLNHRHTYSYGAHAVHIAVDPKLGRIKIIDYVVVQDVGRAVNPLTLRGQVIGSLVQGLGGACLEHLQYDDRGPVPDRFAGRLSAADRDRLPQPALRGARGSSLADQSIGRERRRRGRHYRGGRRDGQRGRQRTEFVRGRAA